MKLGLEYFIDDATYAHVEEIRRLSASIMGSSNKKPQVDLLTDDGLKAARSQLRHRPPDQRAVECLAISGSQQVPVRIITPRRDPAHAVYLQIHGGGFYMDSATRSDVNNVVLADTLQVVVVSVDYRLAPEYPWPAAPNDCETAAIWLAEEAESLFGTGRLLIGGASAGANLAMTTLLRLRDRDLMSPFAGAVLQFGAYDLSGQSPGGRLYADEQFIQLYAGNVTDRSNPDISPLYGDLKNLPPTLLVVGSDDLLLEDSLALAGRLSVAGNDVDLRIYPEAFHGFTSFPSGMASTALADINLWCAQRLGDNCRFRVE